VREEAQRKLGLGSRQVLAIEYWLRVSGITESVGGETRLTAFGKAISDFDPRLEERETWYALHHYLASARNNASTYWLAFRRLPDTFSRQDLDYGLRMEFPGLSDRTYSDAATVFFSICTKTEISTLCRLVRVDQHNIEKVQDPPLPLGLVAFALTHWVERTDVLTAHFSDLLGPDGPLRPFGVSPEALVNYLENIQERYDRRVTTHSQTAGLNSVAFARTLPSVSILRAAYREKLHRMDPLTALERELEGTR